MASGRDYSPRRGKVLVPRKDQLVNAITTGLTKDHFGWLFRSQRICNQRL